MSENKYTLKLMEFVQRNNALGVMGETAEEKGRWIEQNSERFDSITEYLSTIAHCGVVASMSYSGLSYDNDALQEAHLRMERAEQLRRKAHKEMIGTIKLIEYDAKECGMDKFFDVSYDFGLTTDFFKENDNKVLIMRDELSEEIAKFVGEMTNNADIITFDTLAETYKNGELDNLEMKVSDKMQEFSDRYDDLTH